VVSVLRLTCTLLAGVALAVAPLAGQNAPPPTQTPVPRPAPFPGGATGAATAKPGTPEQPAAAAQDAGAADPRLTGIPIYEGARFLESLDIGSGQRVFLFGTSSPYADVVSFYKTQMRTSGREVFRTPAMQQFELGRFQSSTMVYQPSVVVKDYGQPGGAGYLHTSGTTVTRYVTVIQIVPVER
jgi:hypothetical protein